MKIRYLTESIDELKAAYSSATDTIFGYDSETTGLSARSDKLRLMQFCIEQTTYILDCFTIPNVFRDVNALLQTRADITLVGQNLKFDIQFLWANGIDPEFVNVMDTMLSAKILESGFAVNFGLDDIAARYLDIIVAKEEQKSDWSVQELSESQLKYAAVDAVIVRKLYPVLMSAIESNKLQNVFKLEHRCLFATAAMEFNGAYCNIEQLEAMAPVFEKKQEKAKEEFLGHVKDRYVKYNLQGEIIDTGLNLNSPVQMLKVLQDLGIPDPDEPDTLIQSTGSNVFKLLDLDDYPVLDALMTFKKASKLLSGYIYSLPKMVNPVTGRIHTSYSQMIRTGRFSSSCPNLQNIPRPSSDNEATIKEAFQPKPGYVYVAADYSQIELRVMAEVIYLMTGDSSMLDEFLNKKDPYVNTGALLMGYNYDDMFENGKLLPQYKPLRQIAKPIRLGTNYGMKAAKLKNYSKQSYNVSMTKEEAYAHYDNYVTAYPGLLLYHATFATPAIKQNPVAYTLPPFNRPRYWDEYQGTTGLSNHGIQGTSADITKLAMCLIYEELYDLGYSPTQSWDIMPVFTIHDEIVLEVVEHLSALASELLERHMIGAAKYVLKLCPIEAEVKIQTNLADK